MKKYIFAAVLSLALLVSPAFTQAAALTSTQISAIVSLLQSFGADQTTINNVQISLGGGTSTTGGGGTKQWCHTFNTDLTVGSSGAEVSALYRAIYFSGIAQTPETDTSIFGENMAGYVVQFQAKYGIGQTGYVGPITRAKLNSLYGCSSQPPVLTQPHIDYVQAKASPTNTIYTGEETTIFGRGFSPNSVVKVIVAPGYPAVPVVNTPSASGRTNSDGTQIVFTVPNDISAMVYSLSVYDGNSSSNVISVIVKVPGVVPPQPYITSAGSDLAGNATMKGVRFGNQGSNVATMIRLNGQAINSGANTNNGYYIVNYVDGVGYINFRPADFGITTSGYYQVQIINSSTGNSNLVTLNYTAPGITSTWSQASSGGSIARRLQYVSPTKIYGIGLDNAIWRWNGGSSWTSITQGSIKDDFVMVNGSESDIYAIGLDNQIWHWNGARWSQTSDGGKIQQKIWYVDGNHVYGIGMDNQVWRWGSAGGWVQITSNGQVKDDFHFISESDIYAFGLNDGVWHWDGSSWSPVSSGGSITLRLQYVSPTLMYGIGLDNKIWRWNGGSSWTQIAKSGQIKRDFVLVNNSENDIYAIGLDNQIWHLGPSTLSIKSGNFNPGLASVLGAFSGTNEATDSVSQSADKRTDNFTYVWNRDLQIGSPYSDDIIALQQALAREGVYAGEITGGFYNQTYTAARAFQEKYGINQTGYVGLLTRSKLNTLYSQ